jgi:hypothetical protein
LDLDDGVDRSGGKRDGAFIVGLAGAEASWLASILKIRGNGVGGLCRRRSQADALDGATPLGRAVAIQVNV